MEADVSMRKRRIGMVQAEPRPAGSLRRRRGARPRLARLWRRCPSSPRLNFSSLSLHQHHVTSAHAIGWQLYRHLHIHAGARGAGGAEEGRRGSGVTAGARAPHLSHARSGRPAPLRGPPPRAPGAAPPGPSRAGPSHSVPVPVSLCAPGTSRYPRLSHRSAASHLPAAASPRPAPPSMAGEPRGAEGSVQELCAGPRKPSEASQLLTRWHNRPRSWSPEVSLKH